MAIEIININISSKDIDNRIDYLLSKKITKLSRNRIQNAITEGLVEYNSKIVKDSSLKIKEIGVIRLKIHKAKTSDIKAQKIELDVCYEDNDLIVVNKPSGMVVHPATGNYQNTLVNALLYHCKGTLSGIGGIERPGIVHRIDKMTSGLLIIAKNDYVHMSLSEQFKRKQIKRKYKAITTNELMSFKGEIKKNLERSKFDRKKIAVTSSKRGKTAHTSYSLINKYLISDKLTLNLINCELFTGRTHQIRVHMSSIGSPILGDLNYGKKINIHNNNFDKKFCALIEKDWHDKKRHALHAETLGFFHPVKKKAMYFKSSLPNDFSKLLKYIEKFYIDNNN